MTGDTPQLHVSTSSGDHFLGEGQEYVIGRDPSCNIVIEDGRVSRRQALLRVVDGTWTLRDADSRNGTFLDGEPVTNLWIESAVTITFSGEEDAPSIGLEPQTGRRPEREPGVFKTVHHPGGSSLRIGRADDNDLVIDDLSVSRYHAELRLRGDDAEIVDLSSYNGTYVDGRAVHRADVGEVDLISIGHHTFRFISGALHEYVDVGGADLEVSGLEVTAHGEVRVSDVTFGLPESSFCAIVGPSGAGKTTLLKALTGLLPPSGGKVLYRGRNLYRAGDVRRQQLGFVPQEDIVHTELTVEQALRYAAALRFPPDVPGREAQRRVDQVMGSLGIAGKAGDQIASLSGGQRKRVNVAHELITRPSLLFLDEPTSGLDPGLERSLMLMLRGQADGGRTLIIATHNTASLSLCDRVLFIAPGGTTAYFGPPDSALAYFQADDYPEIFQRLETERNVDWAEDYRESPAYHRYVTTPLADDDDDPSLQGRPIPQVKRRGAFRQFLTLTRRYLTVLGSDKRRLAFLLLQAPILGLILLLALDTGEFAPPQSLRPAFAAVVIAALVLSVTWMGISNSIREIVKERPIYLRERVAGLSPLGYVLSKALVLGIITAIQAAVVGWIAIQRQDGPVDGVVLPWPDAEFVLVLVLTGVAAMTLGLAVSAWVATADRAMTIFPLLLVLQLLLVGVFPGVDDAPVIGPLQDVAAARWGYAAAASTVDLNDLEKYNNVVLRLQKGRYEELTREELLESAISVLIEDQREFEDEDEVIEALRDVIEEVEFDRETIDALGSNDWRHEGSIWARNMGALAILALIGFIAAWAGVRWRERVALSGG